MYKWTYQTEIGNITIGANDQGVTYLRTHDTYEGAFEETELIQKAYGQLLEYLDGHRREFDLPLVLEGTDFQKKVWETSCHIPYGKTTNYQKLAEVIDRPKAIRAVGAANGQNPIWIMVPCHRVIGTNGSLTGYGGGLPMKKRLLELESKYKEES